METFHSGPCFRGRIESCCILQEYRSVNRVSLSLVVGFIVLTVGGPAPVRAQQQAPSATFGTIIGLGGTPSDIVLDELRGRLYLVNNSANRVDIWGINENTLIGSISVGLTPLAGAISMDGAFLYVTNQASSSLSVIDLSTRTVVQN